jgi:hypothetical protein
VDTKGRVLTIVLEFFQEMQLLPLYRKVPAALPGATCGGTHHIPKKDSSGNALNCGGKKGKIVFGKRKDTAL